MSCDVLRWALSPRILKSEGWICQNTTFLLSSPMIFDLGDANISKSLSYTRTTQSPRVPNEKSSRRTSLSMSDCIINLSSRQPALIFHQEAKAKHEPGKNHFIYVQSKVGVTANAIWLLKFHSTLWDEIQKARGSWSLANSNRRIRAKIYNEKHSETFAFLTTRASS